MIDTRDLPPEDCPRLITVIDTEEELFEVIAKYKKVCDGIGEHVAHVALAWVRQQQGVTTVLVGARTAAEVAMNLPAFDLTISDETVQELNALTEGIKKNLGSSPDMWQGTNRMR